MAVGWSKNRREGEVLAGGLGLPFFPRYQVHRTNEKGFLKIPGLRERSPADPFLLLVGLQKK
jgi:hypothetical protein